MTQVTRSWTFRRLMIGIGVLEIVMPKLMLITASSPEIRTVRRSRFLNFQQITMPYLAARAPSNWEVIHIDEEAEEIDWSNNADVVGITFHTPIAFHAYDLASRFRSRGTCLVMGGPHVTLVPEEASQHLDAISRHTSVSKNGSRRAYNHARLD